MSFLIAGLIRTMKKNLAVKPYVFGDVRSVESIIRGQQTLPRSTCWFGAWQQQAHLTRDDD
eukprot:CAMPEP_0115835664 /NCGR_PEP_ID=MMETSP0287-20121206/4311_1 /TAXON_ID=412157 /ORGANISM="Chrysochromulina rotalis, Strain UIO044" /LENGTH=60 /DNA_ID=CAMNT_0003289129 /DNA_START=1288 /DNA_END=1467 /DNA_ORIENTATION=-